jgi:hypothetical protein
MRKYLWPIAGLTLLLVVALGGWRWAIDRRAHAEVQPAAAGRLDAKRREQAHAASRLEAESKLTQVAASPASADAASEVPNGGDQGEPGEVDTRWRVAVELPDQVREQLANSDDPILRQIRQRNRRLMKARGDDDTWASDMQARLDEFFASRPEADGMQITVACREAQCQVQASSLSRSAADDTPSRALFDELRRHWWFRDRLIMAQGHVSTVHGRLYHVQYFDRQP